MALGYGYVERDVDSQINWAEVGKNMSDMLLEVNRVRQEKKDAIDQSTREALDNLANAPQGINQDVNNFTNNFSSDISSQINLDVKALKSGQMDLKTFTLRRQNYDDGTRQLFKLSKTYQDNAQKIMEGIDKGEIQSGLALFNMGTVEGYGDFNNSRATIDSLGDGRIGIALYENKMVDGKMVRVLSKNAVPVNVIMGKILNQPKKFDVEKATDASVKAFGTRAQALYRAASTSKAGTITELLGIDSLKKYPQYAGIVTEMNKAIDDQIGSYFSNPLNLTSVLTENTGKYDSTSFTYNREEAQKDPNKILLKINPNTQTPTMDETSPNYKRQYKEGVDWARTNIMSKLDSEAKISTTSQLQDQSGRGSGSGSGKKDEKPAVEGKEILTVTKTNAKGEKRVSGISQRLDNLVIPEAEGVENIITDIGYNGETRALEIKGYQATGKESAGTKEDVNVVSEEDDGTGTPKTVTKGKNVVNKKSLLTKDGRPINDINNASLVSSVVTKIPNPYEPGTFFRDINQAKAYYKRQYEYKIGRKELD